jgi:hypothetical protein
MRTGTLVAWSCTTGWADWVHGELWLLPDGLLRVRTSFGETMAHGVRPLPVSQRGTKQISDEDLEAAVCAHRTNHWIRAGEIASASFRRGLTTTRLAVELAGGDRRKLLWLRREPADHEVPDALVGWGVTSD